MSNTSGPRCPNHLVPLTRTNDKGIGICPVSGYRFRYKADESEKDTKVKYDKFGNTKEEQGYKMISLDGDGG